MEKCNENNSCITGMWSVSGEHLVIYGKGGGSRSMHCLVVMNFCYQLLVRDQHYH